jgi:hypothetical protein
MGLMLAFTFGWAAARVDARQSVRVAEAQAIGRLYRLSVFLPEDDQERLRATLREYITASLAVRDTGSFVRAFRQREVMHHVLWQVVTKAAQEHQNVNSNIVAQLVASVNEVLDAHLSRAIMAVSSRIPTGIVGGLLVILALTMGMIGYQLGVAGSPRSVALIPLVISTATFVLIIADLDRPLEGLLHVHDQALAELQRQLQGWR